MMEPTTTLLLAVLGLALVFGAAAQLSRVCVPGGLSDWMFRGEHGRLEASAPTQDCPAPGNG